MIYSDRFKLTLLLGACFACLLWTLLYACQFQGEIVDENYHAAQIFAFLRGNFVVVPALTTVPGYHLLMAGIAKLLSLHSMQGLRIINVSFGFISAFIFYAIRRFFDDPNALIYSVAFFFFPIFYPYYFLVYTDILSLSLILAAFLMALNERHILAACLLTFALLVRQNNVIWAAFFLVFSIFSSASSRSFRNEMVSGMKTIAPPYMIPVAIFLVYWAWHGSISYSKVVADKHPDLVFHLGNLYFLLFVFVLLFLADAFRSVKKYTEYLQRKPWLIVIPALFVVFAHLEGSPDNYIGTHYFLRNALIQIVSHAPANFAFAAVVAMGFCGMVFSRFLLPHGWLIYPFSAIYLAASWLIESRYLIIPFALWMAMRRVENAKATYRYLAVWASISLFFVHGIFSGKFML